jgi:hypothetical protein
MRKAPNFVDLTGQRFGKNLVIRKCEPRIYNGKHGNSRWLVRCDCGNERIITDTNLKRGRSCGCGKEPSRFNGETKRAASLRFRYRMSVEQFDTIFATQKGKCKLCREALTQTLCIDHDHSCCPGKRSCGKCIRGLLCPSCNKGLGLFHDSVELLKLAVVYLSESNRVLFEPIVTQSRRRRHKHELDRTEGGSG